MSTRTIVEINHDFLNEITPDAVKKLVSGLASAETLEDMNRKRELRPFRFLARRHHSEKVSLEVE